MQLHHHHLLPFLLLPLTTADHIALHPPQYALMTAQTDAPSGPPLLSDVIPLDKSISIFSGFTRSVSEISTRIGDAGTNTTVLAPSNIAITKLPRKPWEDPDDGGAGGNVLMDTYRGIKGEDRAGRNLRQFVEAHCVEVSPWEERVKAKTLIGNEIWWEEGEDGKKRIYPDGVEVIRVQGEVENGALWILDGVVNY